MVLGFNLWILVIKITWSEVEIINNKSLQSIYIRLIASILELKKKRNSILVSLIFIVVDNYGYVLGGSSISSTSSFYRK